MSRWTPRTTNSGLRYGGSANAYYWSSANNPYAYPSLCLANCTTYAWGRIKEAGDTDPVNIAWAQSDLGSLPSAWQWIWYPSSDWIMSSFANKPRALRAGDLVVWSDNVNGQSRNHVAVIEEVISSRMWYISESLWTEGASARGTGDFQTISDWMLANAPARFFSYRILDLDAASPSWYGEQWPDYVLLNPNPHLDSKFGFFQRSKKIRRRRIIYV